MKEIYQILAGALGQEERLAQMANNLANVNTPGYRQDRSVFNDYFAQALATQGSGDASGAANSAQAGPAPARDPSQTVWPVLSGTYVDAAPGPVHMTGGALDAAIQGDGFFQVQVEGQPGTFYTRAGNFSLNASHELVTASGHRVLDSRGSAISIDLAKGAAAIAPDGAIHVGKEAAGTLGVVRFDDPTKLTKYGDGLLQAPQGIAAQPVATPTLQPGALEGSNVNPISSMIEMIQLERAYQSNQKAMQSLDQLMTERIQAAR